MRPGQALLELIGRVFFLTSSFPLPVSLLGVWVVAARPRDKNAWFLLGILQYFVIIFAENQYWPGPTFSLP